ncbi:MAG: hypothetical protein ABRQ38_22050 [Candidatus Eremiobacterota bacterium]
MFRHKNLIYPFILLVLIISVSLTGCGGGDNNSSVINPVTVSDKGSIEITVPWPEKGKEIESQLIPSGVIKIEIIITGQGLSSPLVVSLNNGENTTTIPDIPAGEKQIEFKGLDDSGNILCHRITSINVVANQINSLSAILGVSILSTGYCPESINISSGDTLYWINNDSVVHSVTCSKFDSKDILPGEEYSYTFNEEGRYEYRCSHCDFKGVVIAGREIITSPPTQQTAVWSLRYVNQFGSHLITALGIPIGIAHDDSGYNYVADSRNNLIVKYDSGGNCVNSWDTSQFFNPYRITVDQKGFIYATVLGGHSVVRFDQSDLAGTLTSWGSYGSGSGQFNYPVDVEVDQTGLIYVADMINNRVVRFDPNDFAGTFTPFFPVNYPYGIAVAPSGLVYAAESSSNKIVTFDPNNFLGIINSWGSGGSGSGQFNGVTDVEVDQSEKVYVTDRGNYRIVRFDPSNFAGTFTSWGTHGSGTGQFLFPFSLATDGAENIYVADWDRSSVIKFNQSDFAGTFTVWNTVSAGAGLNAPRDVALDGSGHVYVADTWNHRIAQYDITGNYLSSFGITGSGTGQFHFPSGVAADGAGYVYVADQINNRIVRFDPSDFAGTFTSWGSSGSGSGEFNQPADVTVDLSGKIYVSDQYNNRLVSFDPSDFAGTFTSWGSSGSGSEQFNHPCGMATDRTGKIYVSDKDNNRIVRFDPNSFSSTFTSLGQGQVKYPYGVTADSSGKIYVSDTGNNRIVRFDSFALNFTYFGSSGSGAGQFKSPIGITLDKNGRIYVADSENHRIQILEPYMYYQKK